MGNGGGLRLGGGVGGNGGISSGGSKFGSICVMERLG
jgi:hypothetical protein